MCVAGFSAACQAVLAAMRSNKVLLCCMAFYAKFGSATAAPPLECGGTSSVCYIDVCYVSLSLALTPNAPLEDKMPLLWMADRMQ